MKRLAALAFVALTGLAETLAQDGSRDRVTYTSFRPGAWGIYLLNGAGQPPKRLSADSSLDYDPVVSPDGRWVVFCSERRDGPDLFALDLKNGGDPRLLIDSDGMEDQAAFSTDGETIAFVSTSSGNADIYVLPFRPGRTALIEDARNLTKSASGEFRPAFSPDGQTLAFSSDRDTDVLAVAPIVRLRDGDIYLLALGDGEVRRLTSAPGWDGSPAWSPDGKSIAYYHGEPRTADSWRETRTQIWMMNSDGSDPRALTLDETTALSPAFLPDGRICYSRKQPGGRWELVSIRNDGTGNRPESAASEIDYWEPAPVGTTRSIVAHGAVIPEEDAADASWSAPLPASFGGPGPFIAGGSPSRRRLPDREIDLYAIRYFAAILHPKHDSIILLAPPGPSDILLARLAGTERRKLLEFDQSGGAFSSASWSRDGDWVAITRGNARRLNGEADIWKIRPDGSGLANLTAGMPGNQSFPSYSADGQEIVFRNGANGRFELYTMNADGKNVRRLPTDAADAIFPVFSPVARQIAFASNRDGLGTALYEVYLLGLNEDGSEEFLRRLTHNQVQEGHVAFSYDGKWLIFSSEQGGISDEEPLVQSALFAPQMYGEIYAYRIEDGFQIRLTHNKWEEGIPSWEAAPP